MNGESPDTGACLFTLDELACAVTLPRRTVRYYIQIGLLDRPRGRGRGAHYTRRHLEQLEEIKKLQQAGLSLESIRAQLDPDHRQNTLQLSLETRRKGTVEIWSHVLIDEGIELSLNPTRLNLTPEEVRALAVAVTECYEQITQDKEKTHDDD